jgi:hypothetical protein
MARGIRQTVAAAAGAMTLVILVSASTVLAASGPVFKEHFGAVDPPCPGPSSSAGAGSCVAHVYLENSGGEGSGVVTMNVPLKGAAQAAQCQAVIPPTGGGEYVDVSCKFTMPPGAQLGSPPNVSDISVSVPGTLASTAGGSDLTGIAVLVLAAVTTLLALGTFTVAQAARRAAGMAAGAGLRSRPEGQSAGPEQPATANDSYTLPALPR